MLAELLEPSVLPLVLAGVVTLALAFWLAALDISSPANRTFAALLLFLGVATLLGPVIIVMSEDTSSQTQALALAQLAPYPQIAVPFLLAGFLSRFPMRRGLLGTSRVAAIGLAGVAIALLLWYLVDHAQYATLSLVDNRVNGNIGLVRFDHYGPLALFLGLRRPLYALAALILARDYARDPSGSGGYSTFLLFAGFEINAVFDGVTFTWGNFELVKQQGWAFLASGDWIGFGLPALTLPLAAWALVYMARAMRHEKEDATLQEARRFMLYVLPAVVLAGFAISFRPWNAAMADARPFLIGVVRLIVPLLLAYALLRYSLFSLDVKIKAGVRHGILLGLFVGVFFLVSESAEAIVQNNVGPVVGVLAAGGLAVLGKPIERLGARAADGIMPDTKPVHMMGSQERFRMYRDHFELVQMDGHVSEKERRMLGRLAPTLGISENEASHIEKGRFPKRDDPPPPRTRRTASRIVRTVVAIVGTALIFGVASAILESLFHASSFAIGLVTAAIVALLLGPIESLSERLTRRRRLHPSQEKAMRDALVEAWADGELSARDKTYLAILQKRLRVRRAERRRIEREVLRSNSPSPRLESRRPSRPS